MVRPARQTERKDRKMKAVVIEDSMISGYYRVVDEEVQGTLADLIDWYPIAYSSEYEAQVVADGLNRADR